MKVVGLLGVMFSALALYGQSHQPVRLGPNDAAPVRIRADAAQRMPCGSSPDSKEKATLSHNNSLCGSLMSAQYPPEARRQRIQGAVHLRAVIGKDGLIKGLQVIDGHPLLIASAADAVKSWKYKPYRIKGKPVEIETVITVNYSIKDP
jgi:TonB family protein